MPAPTIAPHNVEFRYRVTPVELRQDGEAAPRRLAGHAAVTGVDTPIGPEDDPWWIERVQPGAFARVLNDPETAALFNHDPMVVLGRLGAGTLRLTEDAQGLSCEIDPPDTQWGRDVTTMVERRDITQMSIGFVVGRQMWEDLPDGKVRRTILEVKKLYDVSPVTFAAFPTTDVAVREARASGLIVRVPQEMQEAIARQQQELRNRLAAATDLYTMTY